VPKSTQQSVIACPHRPPCPGCPNFGRSGLAPASQHTLARLAARFGLTLAPLVASPRLGFRHRARLAVRGRATSPKIGIFQRGSHRLADVPRCPIHHPLVNRVALAVRDAIRASGARPYADAPHRGLVRYVQIVVERASERAQVVLVANDVEAAATLPLAERLRTVLGDDLHSLWWNGNPARTNTILGPHWQRLHGPEAVCETLGGAAVFFPPGAFGQANLLVADDLVAAVHARVSAGARVAELYAGTGAFGLGLLARGATVAFNEVSEHGLHGLRLGLDAVGHQARDRASIHAGPAGEHADLIAEADVVIADPPRRGLDAPVTAALRRRPPARLLLVSCDALALERDVLHLASHGLALRSLQPFEMFPYTTHVETLALLEPH
jgi:23S rRNA (uracil1939-C5)-methyltransferase